jgi:hypothetical protein
MEPSIQWGTPQGRAILMIPGPTELPWSVVQAMNQPPTIQYDMNFDVNVLEPTTLALRDVFQAPRGRGHRDAGLRPHRARGGRHLRDRAR